MRTNFFYRIRLLFLLLACQMLASSCNSDNTTKARENKTDSLEKRTQHIMDSTNEAIMKQINSMPDSTIVNDADAPSK